MTHPPINDPAPYYFLTWGGLDAAAWRDRGYDAVADLLEDMQNHLRLGGAEFAPPPKWQDPPEPIWEYDDRFGDDSR